MPCVCVGVPLMLCVRPGGRERERGRAGRRAGKQGLGGSSRSLGQNVRVSCSVFELVVVVVVVAVAAAAVAAVRFRS